MLARDAGWLDVTVKPGTCAQGSIALAASRRHPPGKRLSGAGRAAYSGNARELAAEYGIRHKDWGDC